MKELRKLRLGLLAAAVLMVGIGVLTVKVEGWGSGALPLCLGVVCLGTSIALGHLRKTMVGVVIAISMLAGGLIGARTERPTEIAEATYVCPPQYTPGMCANIRKGLLLMWLAQYQQYVFCLFATQMKPATNRFQPRTLYSDGRTTIFLNVCENPGPMP